MVHGPRGSSGLAVLRDRERGAKFSICASFSAVVHLPLNPGVAVAEHADLA